MITDLDKNKNNNIDFEEFLDMMTARMSDRDTREDINKVFRLFDDDGTGSISIRNLRRVARELGETMTDEELQEMIDRADSNGDSQVTPDDFYNIMTKKTFVWDRAPYVWRSIFLFLQYYVLLLMLNVLQARSTVIN